MKKFDELSYIAIDPSLRGTGVYVNGLPSTIKTKRKFSAETAKENIWAGIRAAVKRSNIEICFIEDYSRMGSSNGSLSAWAVAEVRGIITAIMIEHEVPIISVSIPMWKSLAGFKQPKAGKGWRENYTQKAEEKFGGRFGSPDEVDAYLIYWTARKVYETGGHTATQRRLYEKIKKEIEKISGE